MIRGFLLIFLLISIAIVSMAGFRGQHSSRPPWEIFPDMVRQPKVRAQSPLRFFADDRGPRMPVGNTVPMGYEPPEPQRDAPPEVTPSGAAPGDQLSHQHLGFSSGTDYYNTGKMGGNWGSGLPVPVDAALMQRGQQRFNINCSVCHGLTAAGNGIAKQYGLATVVSLQDPRIRTMADGEIFDTITHGKNTMMSYGGNVPVGDRWAIIAYLRALQRSQNATAADVPPDQVAQLDQAAASPAAATSPPAGAPKK
jgi:mono/diheme cytochrome c family protein